MWFKRFLQHSSNKCGICHYDNHLTLSIRISRHQWPHIKQTSLLTAAVAEANWLQGRHPSVLQMIRFDKKGGEKRHVSKRGCRSQEWTTTRPVTSLCAAHTVRTAEGLDGVGQVEDWNGCEASQVSFIFSNVSYAWLASSNICKTYCEVKIRSIFKS